METFTVKYVKDDIHAWVNNKEKMTDVDNDIDNLRRLVWAFTHFVMEWFAGKYFKNIWNNFETLTKHKEEGSCKQYFGYRIYAALNWNELKILFPVFGFDTFCFLISTN